MRTGQEGAATGKKEPSMTAFLRHVKLKMCVEQSAFPECHGLDAFDYEVILRDSPNS